MPTMPDLNAKRVTVMGLGRFGGGLAVTKYLASQGAQILLTDLDSHEALREPLAELKDLIKSGQVTLRLGQHCCEDFTAADLIVANPAVPTPWNNQYLCAATNASVPVTTEIQLAIKHLDRTRTIAITGSAGKSTTAAMTHAALQATGIHAILSGNIGGSILNTLDQIAPETIIVLELSSAMLHWLKDSNWSPAVAAITNCTQNHTDWHGDFAHYQTCKQSILTNQLPGDTAVLDHSVNDWKTRPSIERIILSPADQIKDCTTPGTHNARNAALALAAANAMLAKLNLPTDQQQLQSAIRAFPGLPHRLSLCHELDGIRFYNDSKCTVPAATLLAVDALTESTPANTIHLIAGGYDKGINLADIANLAPQLAGLYTIGTTAQALAGAAVSNAHACTDLKTAMQRIMDRIKPGDTVLLSPGCASWDQFTNYEHRGETFRQLAVAFAD